MNFTEIAENRQSCRSYDPARAVEQEKLDAILAAARLAPSACNGQPYHITVCKGEAAKAVAALNLARGRREFIRDVPVMLVISAEPYNVADPALATAVDKFRSIDVGILAAYITAEATAQGLGTCILGWQDDDKLRELCHLDAPVRLVITLGYAKEDDPLRPKKRKAIAEMVDVIE